MPISLELRHLRSFVVVAEELHFSRAAERIQIAQPALSQQIKKLEREVGVELFHRTKRRVELSAAGTAMLEPARRTLAEAATVRDVAQRAARGEIGHLTVGFIESAAMTFVPTAVRSFRVEHPKVGLTLRELPVDVQIARLRAGRLDVAIVRSPAETEGLRVASIADESLVVVVPEAHPLATLKRVSPQRLAAEPLVLLAREAVPSLYDQAIALLRGDAGARIAQEATSIQAVLGLVAAGLGVSLLPSSVKSLARTGISFTELSPSPRSTIQLAWRDSDRSPLTAAFLAAAQAN